MKKNKQKDNIDKDINEVDSKEKIENISTHEDSHIHDHNDSKENIKIAFFLNLIFSALEAIGGFLTNSISIFTDSIHDLGDSFSIGISYLLEKKSQKSADNTYTFGYLRYSLLGAIITSMVLITGSIVVLYNAIPRLIHPEEINHDAMIIFAIFGVFINGYAAYKTSRSHNHNEKSINLHMLEDVLGWIAVLIGSIFIKLYNWIIIDPILSILIALYILYHVYRNIKEVFDIFMEKVPKNINIEAITKDIENYKDSIKDIHHIHVWSLDGINNCMTAHIHLNKELNKDEIIALKKEIKKKLLSYDIHHATLEIEYSSEKCDNKKC